MQIAAADPYIGDLEENILVTDIRFGDFTDLNGSFDGGVIDYCREFHG
jgi:hypothetical protein